MPIANDRRHLVDPFLEPNPFRVHAGTDHVDGGAHDDADVDRLFGERHLAGDDAGDVQHLFDQADLRFGIAFDDLDGMRGAWIEVSGAQNPRPAEDGIERRSQLVRQRAEEFILEAIGLLRLAVQLNAIQRQTDPSRQLVDDGRT